MRKTEYFIHSTNGKSRLHVIEWQPEGEIRAILQIAHGMAEYIDRYDRFASDLADGGILVIGNDHLGHGQSAEDDDELGYFPGGGKSAVVVADLYRITMQIRAKHPEAPFFLMGHSMGSFLARRYIMEHGTGLSGAIIMGTGAQPPATLKAAKALAGTVGRLRGEHYRSPLLNNLAFGAYNKRIPDAATPFDWLSVNPENVKKYIADPHCGYVFTVNGFQTLFDVIGYIQEDAHIRKIPADLPLLFVAGEEDPVGGYAKDVKAVASAYRKAGIKEIKEIYYKGCRHEILNEEAYPQVAADIRAFLEAHI